MHRLDWVMAYWALKKMWSEEPRSNTKNTSSSWLRDQWQSKSTRYDIIASLAMHTYPYGNSLLYSYAFHQLIMFVFISLFTWHNDLFSHPEVLQDFFENSSQSLEICKKSWRTASKLQVLKNFRAGKWTTTLLDKIFAVIKINCNKGAQEHQT
mgnify:CR=1 FL=1